MDDGGDLSGGNVDCGEGVEDGADRADVAGEESEGVTGVGGVGREGKERDRFGGGDGEERGEGGGEDETGRVDTLWEGKGSNFGRRASEGETYLVHNDLVATDAESSTRAESRSHRTSKHIDLGGLQGEKQSELIEIAD